MSILAVVDEIHQGAVEGRNGSFKDVGIDCLGSLTVLFILFIILAMIRFYNANRKIKETMNVLR